jgi:hypothetical protein
MKEVSSIFFGFLIMNQWFTTYIIFPVYHEDCSAVPQARKGEERTGGNDRYSDYWLLVSSSRRGVPSLDENIIWLAQNYICTWRM